MIQEYMFQLQASFLRQSRLRVSTCFSGICCAGTGLEMIQAAARQQLTHFSLEVVSACDSCDA